MLTSSRSRTKSASTHAKDAGRTVSLAEAKAHLSSVISGVEQSRLPVTVLRRGVPVAQIIPVTQTKSSSGFGYMRGTVHVLGDIVGRSGEEWDV